MKVVLPDGSEHNVKNITEAMMTIQAFAQYKFADYAEMVDKLQMDIGSKKQKIMPGIMEVPASEAKNIERNIEERVTDLNASISPDDGPEEEIPDFSIELEKESDEKGKIWLPEPFGPQTVEDIKETTYVINAYCKIAMPDLIDMLNNTTVITDDDKRMKVIPSVDVVPLKDFIRANQFIALKINAISVLKNHFEKKAFDICPDCGEVQMERTLSCYVCGYTRKLNQGVDNL